MFTLGYPGITGGPGDLCGAGGGISTIPGTVAVRGGGTAATGIRADNRLVAGLGLATVGNWGRRAGHKEMVGS